MRDLSDIEDAEEDMYEAYRRGLTLTVWLLELFLDAFECVDEVRMREEEDCEFVAVVAPVAISMVSSSQARQSLSL